MLLSKTIFEYVDSWSPFAKRFLGKFYTVGKILYRPEDSRVRPHELYSMLILGNTEEHH